MASPPPLVVLGCGFAGTATARLALARGRAVIATTRDEAAADALRLRGLDARTSLPELPAGADVLVAFPPDGATDDVIAPALVGARAVVYLSTTGVYGGHRGRVDEDTPVDPGTPAAHLRLDAEARYRAVGAVVLRCAGIYGPGRGLHRRLARGDFRVPGDGSNVVSRVHVDDLAGMVMAALERGPALRGQVFVVADDAPVPQIEVIRWLCATLGVPLPPSVPVGEAPATLRHDRAVDNRRVKAALGVALRYPTYREGFAQCLAVERGG